MSVAQALKLSAAALSHMLTQKCDIRQRTFSQDSRGGKTETFTLVEAQIPCTIRPRSASANPASQYRDGTDYTHRVYLGARPNPLTTDHQILSGSRIFEVVEPINVCDSNVIWSVGVKEID